MPAGCGGVSKNASKCMITLALFGLVSYSIVIPVEWGVFLFMGTKSLAESA